MEGAYFLALAAADAAALINMRLPAGKGDAILGAVCQTRPGKTASAGIADQVAVRRAGRASRTDGCENRGCGCIVLHHLFDIFGKALQLIVIGFNVDAQKGHDPVADHRPLLVDAASVGNPLLGNDPDGKLVDILLQRSREELLEHFCMDLTLHQRILVVEFKHVSPPLGVCTASPGSHFHRPSHRCGHRGGGPWPLPLCSRPDS